MEPNYQGAIAEQAAEVNTAMLIPYADSIIGYLRNVQTLLEQQVQLAAKDLAQPVVDTPMDFRTGQIYTVDRKGRRFFYIFSSAAIASCTANVMGTGLYTFTLAAGWNNIAAPDGTIINPPAATSAQVLFRATNWQIGSAL